MIEKKDLSAQFEPFSDVPECPGIPLILLDNVL